DIRLSVSVLYPFRLSSFYIPTDLHPYFTLFPYTTLFRSGLAQEPGTLHCVRLDQRGRDHRTETPIHGGGHRQLRQRQLQARPHARQIVESRSADLGATLDIECAQDFT